MTSTVAELIVSLLQKAGAKRCYGVPGDTLNHVTEALRKSDIRFVHVRHEEVGGFAAGADAMMMSGNICRCGTYIRIREAIMSRNAVYLTFEAFHRKPRYPFHKPNCRRSRSGT